jgi:hypothetical protein
MTKPKNDKRIAVSRAIELADNQYIPPGYASGLPDDISDWAAWIADAAIRAMRPASRDAAGSQTGNGADNETLP